MPGVPTPRVPAAAAWVTAAFAMLAAAAPASGATELGQLDPAATPTASCAADSSWVQKSSATVPGYTVPPGNWVVTAWSHKANGTSGNQLGLRVWRPTADPNVFTMVGGSAFHVLSPHTVNSFATRVPAMGGDVLGLRVPGGAACVFGTGAAETVRFATGPGTDPPAGSPTTLLGEFGSSRLNLTARVEADADLDGHGDESQDLCPTNATIATACPVVKRPDTRAPFARATARRRESVGDGSISIFVRTNEAAAVRVVARVNVSSIARVYRLRLAMRPVRARVRTTLRLKLPARARGPIDRSLRRGVRLRAQVTVLARDSAGNLRRVKLQVRLAP